jgi:transcription initiation factor IIF auxiliary subunit
MLKDGKMFGLNLKNRSSYNKVKRSWEWEAFVDDGDTGELTNIERVDYILHPTSPNLFREVTDPKDGFIIKSYSHGAFSLKAFVHTKDGKKIKLEHELEFDSKSEEDFSQ